MLLTIDIGNTNLTLGLYDDNDLIAHWRLATDHARMPDEYGLQFQGLLENAKHEKSELTGICLASVVPQLTSRVIQACREYLDLEPFVVDVGIKTGIKVRYEDPRAVGADRIADAVAVFYLYRGHPSLESIDGLRSRTCLRGLNHYK
jgi:type III pantothenate kinase